MKPEFLQIPAEQYHADPAPIPSASRSLLHTILTRSPLHAWAEHPRLNTNYQPKEDTKFDIGTAAHSVLLEGIDKVVQIDAEDWRTKQAKEQRDIARSSGGIPLLTSQAKRVGQMVEVAIDYLRRCELGINIQHGMSERSIIWQQGKIWLRSRPDWINEDATLVLDYKTTEANPDQWSRNIGSNGYDLQDIMQKLAVEAVTGKSPRHVFMVQEVSEPYACSLFELSPSWCDIGDRKLQTALSLWQACLARDEWPAYPMRVMSPEPNPWEFTNAEEKAATWTPEAFLFGNVNIENGK